MIVIANESISQILNGQTALDSSIPYVLKPLLMLKSYVIQLENELLSHFTFHNLHFGCIL